MSEELVQLFNDGEIDACKILYPYFKSPISQEPRLKSLIPCEENISANDNVAVQYEYEPAKDQLLEEIIPKNISVQIFQALLETFASEQGARMTAMDNAVNNCADMIKNLGLIYNRTNCFRNKSF